MAGEVDKICIFLINCVDVWRVVTSLTVVVGAVPCLGIVIAVEACTRFSQSRESAVHHGGPNRGVPELVGTASRLSREVFFFVPRACCHFAHGQLGTIQLPPGIPGRATCFKLPEALFQDPSSATMGHGDPPTLQSA